MDRDRESQVRLAIWMPRELRDDFKRVLEEQGGDMTKAVRRYARECVAEHERTAA
jgi:hypothetical protein